MKVEAIVNVTDRRLATVMVAFMSKPYNETRNSKTWKIISKQMKKDHKIDWRVK